MFLILQFPGAQGTASPLISWMLSLPICLQHIQLVWLLHGTVGPRFRPKAIDFKTESLDPMFEAVFFTNWKTGLGVFLNVSVFKRSSSVAFTVFKSLSSLPWHEIISMGLDAGSSFDVTVRSSCRGMLRTLVEMLSSIFRGYSDFSKALHSSFSLFSNRTSSLMIRRRRRHCE